MSFFKLNFATLLAFITLSISSLAQTTNLTATTTASASLANVCYVSSTDVNFGTITASTTGATSATGNLGVLCTKGTSYSIVISLGNNGDRMLKGSTSGQLLYYSICQKPGWSNAGGSSCTTGPWLTGYPYTSVGTGALQNIPVYGYVPNGYYTPDNYSDTEVVTLTY